MTGTRDSNFNQVLWLAIGQFCTFAIAFVTTPVLVRYLDKVEYGTYRQILYVYTSLLSLFTLGLPSVFAYFIPRLNNGQQKQLINKLTLLFLGLGAAFSVALFLLSDLIADILRNPELSIGLKLFSPFPLFTLPTMGVEGIYTAIRKTKEIAIYQCFSKLIMFVCIVCPVMIIGANYKYAIVGWGISQFIVFLVAMYLKNRPYKDTKAEVIPNMYRDIFKYTLPLTGAFIAGFFVNSADQFFISRYYGTEVFSVFSCGCLSIPFVGMIAGSVKSVLLPLFSKADSENNLNQAIVSYGNAVKSTSTILFPMLLFFLFFSSDTMITLFGNQYGDSSTFFRIFILRDFITIFPYFSVLMAFGLSKFYMNMHIVGLVFIWLTDFVIISNHLDASMIVLISTIFFVGSMIAAIIYIYREKTVLLISKEMILHILKLSIHCSLILFILIYFRNSYLSNLSNIFSLISFGSIYYLLIIASGKLIKIDYIESVIRLINRNKQ